jgi:hypothetical protein
MAPVSGKVVALTAVAVGGAAGIIGYVIATAKGTSPSCPSGDVPESGGGTCPSGYEPDPSAPGCCKPTSTSQPLLFEINGDTGNLAFDCPCTLTEPDLVFQVTDATPNGLVEFYVSLTDGNWTELYDYSGLTPVPVQGTADAFGNLSLSEYSCALANKSATINVCAFSQPKPNTLYLIAHDATSNTYSDVIVFNSTCAQPCGSEPFCCASFP